VSVAAASELNVDVTGDADATEVVTVW